MSIYDISVVNFLINHINNRDLLFKEMIMNPSSKCHWYAFSTHFPTDKSRKHNVLVAKIIII